MTAGRLVAHTEKGTKGAHEVLDRFADHLAVGLANLTLMFNPERLILHGDVVAGGEPLRARIEEHTKARVLPYLRPSVQVALSTLDQEAGLLGAAGLVLSETFHLAT
jgi:predicted NBD/HSP70 family sugar kinase